VEVSGHRVVRRLAGGGREAMKASRSRHPKKSPRDDARKPPDDARATRNRHGVVRGASANALAERTRVLTADEESVRRHEHTLSVREATLQVREASTETRADVERLMGQLREANERLIVAAVRAQNLSDDAHMEAAQARTELDDLMRQLRNANERWASAAAEAHSIAQEARQHEEAYRQLSGRLLQLQDEERRRLASDLHDSTAQRLAALTMNLDVVGGAKKALDARSRRALAESRSLAEQCSREVRTLAYLLYPPLLDEAGLLAAVRWYVEGFTKRSGISVAMDLGDLGRLPGPIEMALFRIVQESLTNVHRHASTGTASVRFATTTEALVLEVQDGGHGLRDPLTLQNGMLLPGTLGVGIQGMRERICQLGGSFDVEFTDTGTTVRVCLPLKKDSREASPRPDRR
jgi:signal transduction histidine kinase